MAAKGTITIGRLDSVERVRRELARLYAEARRGRLDSQEASRLGNLLAIIARLLEGAEVERRLEALERAAPERRPEPWRAS